MLPDSSGAKIGEGSKHAALALSFLHRRSRPKAGLPELRQLGTYGSGVAAGVFPKSSSQFIAKSHASPSALERRFAKLVEEWMEGRGPSSSVSRLSMHPSYQQIIGLGAQAIPLILRELEKKPGHWFWALHAIAGVDPVREADRGNLRLMSDAWLKWGKEMGYR